MGRDGHILRVHMQQLNARDLSGGLVAIKEIATFGVEP